jgi:hypothetical protein
MAAMLPRICILCVALLGLACDRGDPDATHQITGTVTDAQGKPLAGAVISINGFPRKGDNHTFSGSTGADGKYLIQVPSGMYDAPQATITRDLNGNSLVLPLHPADGKKDWGEQRDSRNSLSRDFVWKISGARPESVGKPEDHTGWYGGCINVEKGGDVGDTVTLEFTLTPEGPLIDGTPGRPITMTRRLPWRKFEDHLLLDIPIGSYTITARIPHEKKPIPLRLTLVYPTKLEETPEGTTTSVKVSFEQHEPRKGQREWLVPTLSVYPQPEK